MGLRAIRRVVAKIADYTIKPPMDASGTCFTNRAATGTVIFTLPAPGLQLMGVHYRFKALADFTVTVKTATADTLVALNDVAADSVSLQTGGQIIGGEMEAFCDGVSWFVSGITVGHTFTVAT